MNAALTLVGQMSLVVMAVSLVLLVGLGVVTWRAKGRMLQAASSLRLTALRWELLDRPDKAAECIADAERVERQARPRKPSRTSTSTDRSAA